MHDNELLELLKDILVGPVYERRYVSRWITCFHFQPVNVGYVAFGRKHQKIWRNNVECASKPLLRPRAL